MLPSIIKNNERGMKNVDAYRNYDNNCFTLTFLAIMKWKALQYEFRNCREGLFLLASTWAQRDTSGAMNSREEAEPFGKNVCMHCKAL